MPSAPEAEAVIMDVPVEIFSAWPEAAKVFVTVKSTSETVNVKVSEIVVTPSVAVMVNSCEVLVS